GVAPIAEAALAILQRDGIERDLALRVAGDMGRVDPLGGQEIDHLLRELAQAHAAAIGDAPVGRQQAAQIPGGVQRVAGDAQPPQPVLARGRQLDHRFADGKDGLAGHDANSVAMAARKPSRRIWLTVRRTAWVKPASPTSDGGVRPDSARTERTSAASSSPALRATSSSAAPRGSSGACCCVVSQASQVAVAKAKGRASLPACSASAAGANQRCGSFSVPSMAICRVWWAMAGLAKRASSGAA